MQLSLLATLHFFRERSEESLWIQASWPLLPLTIQEQDMGALKQSLHFEAIQQTDPAVCVNDYVCLYYD